MSDVASQQLEALQQLKELAEQFGEMKQRMASMTVSMGELEGRFQEASHTAHYSPVYCDGQQADTNRLPHGPHVIDQQSTVSKHGGSLPLTQTRTVSFLHTDWYPRQAFTNYGSD